MKAIYFDMDGTIADLYGYENWLEMLQAEDVTPYTDCKPLVDMQELDSILTEFTKKGITIGIISWGAMGGSKKYTQQVRKAKIAWCEKYLTCISEYHVVKYGTPKHSVAYIKDSVLVDDNADVRKAWKNGGIIDASNSEQMLETLRELLRVVTLRRKDAKVSTLTKVEAAQEEGLFSSVFQKHSNCCSSSGLYMIGQTTFNPYTQEYRYWVKVGLTKNRNQRINSYLTHCADVYFIDWKEVQTRSLKNQEKRYHEILREYATTERTEFFKVSKEFYLNLCEQGFDYLNFK